jgi:hypothetical protein
MLTINVFHSSDTVFEQIIDKTKINITFQDTHCCDEQVRVCVVCTELV